MMFGRDSTGQPLPQVVLASSKDALRMLTMVCMLHGKMHSKEQDVLLCLIGCMTSKTSA